MLANDLTSIERSHGIVSRPLLGYLCRRFPIFPDVLPEKTTAAALVTEIEGRVGNWAGNPPSLAPAATAPVCVTLDKSECSSQNSLAVHGIHRPR